MVPPPEKGRRYIDWRASDLEPGRTELRLEAKPPCGPLRREPHCGEHDQQHEEDLAPENLGRAQVIPPTRGSGHQEGREWRPSNQRIAGVVGSDGAARKN